MIEKHIVLEDVDPVVFYGVNNTNIQMIKALYPKLRIVARGNIIKVMGDEEEMCAFEENIMAIEQHCVKYNSLKEEDILAIIKGKKTPKESAEGVIVYSVNGKPITARSENQQKLVKAYENNDMIFAIGPAGSGKTYTSIALAVRALKNKEIRKIILSRPAVEAGEKLGFLPGDMKDKIDPYLQPLYDALQDMIPTMKLQEMMEQNVIQIAPLAFMRGRTLNDAVVIFGRSTEHDHGTNQNVPDAYGNEHQNDCYRRHDANRPPVVPTFRTGRSHLHTERRGGDRFYRDEQKRHRAPQTGNPYRGSLRKA